MDFSENYYAFTILLVLLQLTLYDFFSVYAVVLSITVHCYFLDQYPSPVPYLVLYFVHYNLVYLLQVRHLEKAASKVKEEASKGSQGWRTQNQLMGLPKFLQRYQWHLDAFYCVDIPFGTYSFYQNDPNLFLILKH